MMSLTYMYRLYLSQICKVKKEKRHSSESDTLLSFSTMAFSIPKSEKSVWNVLVAVIMLFGGMALLVLIYMWLAWYASRHASRLRAGNNNNNNNHSSKGGHGLSKSDIQKLPTVVCSCNDHQQEKNDDGDDEKKIGDALCINGDLECTVCLEQFKDGERCLLMPTCKHCFHVDCAEAWLSKRPICPLCRTTALPEDEQQPEKRAAYSSHIPDSAVVDIP